MALILLVGASAAQETAAVRTAARHYVVAVDSEYAPFEFVDAVGKVSGFTPDLLREIGRSLGIEFEFRPMAWPEAVAGLQEGSVDIVNMIRTPEREGQYVFSSPHSRISQALFRHKGAAGIRGLDDLAGRKVGFQANDISTENLAEREDFSRHMVQSKLEGFLLLNMGGLDAFFAGEHSGIRLISQYDLKGVELAQGGLFSQDFCFTVRKDNTALAALLNEGLARTKESGVHASLTATWLLGRSPQGQTYFKYAMIIVALLAVGALGLVIWNAALRKVNKTLERYVDERTKELKKEIEERKAGEDRQNKLIDILNRSNSDLERFAYVASHDLKEPIRNILSFAQLLKRKDGESLGADARESLDFIINSATRLHELIKDIMQYSRISANPPQFALVDSNRAVETALENLTISVEASGAELDVEEALPPLWGDQTQLTMLFQNLIANAIKYRHPERTPKIKIHSRRSGEEWVLSVADNGLGIDKQHHKAVFEAFKRMHNPDQAPGTGLGLSICLRIMEMHGGRMWLKSQVGKGSTFFLAVPAREAQGTVANVSVESET